MPLTSNVFRSTPGLFGDGSDGTVTFDGSATILGLVPSSGQYTLTRDLYLDHNSTVTAAATIRKNGFRIFCKGTLNNAGTIYAGSNNASGGTAGAIINATGSLQTAAGNGATGGTSTGAGSAGAGSGGRNVGGGVGGNGGQGDGGNLGGAGNSSAAPTAIQAPARSSAACIRGRLMDATSLNGAGGGGSGGVQLAAGTATAGAGGSGSIAGMIFCKDLNNTGTIHADGGNGGNASVTSNASAGGGGGGGGGYFAIVCEKVTSLGTFRANGGTGGTGAGSSGTNGSAGTAGLVELFTV